LTPPPSELPKAAKAAQLLKFRRALSEERTDKRGKLIPCRAAVVKTDEQKYRRHVHTLGTVSVGMQTAQAILLVVEPVI